MRIEYLSKNRFCLAFSNEEEKRKYVATILEYLQYDDSSSYYYLFFGYQEWNGDITNYTAKYPELNNDKGFIGIMKEDILNVDFIIDILGEFQMASLYISEIPNLDEKYDFKDIRDYPSRFGGYVIEELRLDFIVVQKDDDLPAWDLEKMGVPQGLKNKIEI